MPQELEACVQDALAKDPSLDESNAYAICNSQLGGSNFVSYTLDNKGDLFLKYFLADTSFAQRNPLDPTDGFSLNGGAIAAHDEEAIGLPFSILPNRELSVFDDFHPWHPELGRVSREEHIKFAEQFAPGKIVAVSPMSKLEGAAQDVIANGGRFAVVQITDARAKDAYTKNPDLIPKAVSPGFFNNEAPNKTDIKNFNWVHLAAVPTGAYGEKAKLYASCVGNGTDCVNKLVGAAVLEKAKRPYCPIGASENLLTSHVISNTSNSSMSVNTNPSSEPATITKAVPASAPVAPTPPTGAPISTGTESKGVLRIKTQMQSQSQPQEQKTVNLDEYNKLKADYEKFKTDQQQNARKEEIKKLIPRELFISKGRFDEKAYEAEVDKRLTAGWDNETISDYYNTKLELLKSSNPMQYPVNPLGGSRYQYETPSEVPTLEGGSQVDPIAVKMTNLCKMFGLEVA